jgi:hypothetical protein
MKLCIYLTPEGLEALALGRNLYSWHWGLQEAGGTLPENSIQVATCEAVLPSKEACIPPVLAKLKEREDEINASAQEDLMAIRQRKNDLLMLTCSEEA